MYSWEKERAGNLKSRNSCSVRRQSFYRLSYRGSIWRYYSSVKYENLRKAETS